MARLEIKKHDDVNYKVTLSLRTLLRLKYILIENIEA
ncbi:MAG: hypothetical protein ACJA2M_003103 [Polaribacter sp.]